MINHPARRLHALLRNGKDMWDDASPTERDYYERVVAVLLAEYSPTVASCPHCWDHFDAGDIADGDLLVVCVMCAKAGRPPAPGVTAD